MNKELSAFKTLLTQMPGEKIKAFWDGTFSPPGIEELAIKYPLDYLELLDQLEQEYNLGEEEEPLFPSEINKELQGLAHIISMVENTTSPEVSTRFSLAANDICEEEDDCPIIKTGDSFYYLAPNEEVFLYIAKDGKNIISLPIKTDEDAKIINQGDLYSKIKTYWQQKELYSWEIHPCQDNKQ